VRDDRLYLVHIRECIERIERYTAPGQAAFLADTMIQDAVLRNLHTLSESTQRLSDELKAGHTGVDWRSIAAFRNVVVHNYLGIDRHRSGTLWSATCQASSTPSRRYCRIQKARPAPAGIGGRDRERIAPRQVSRAGSLYPKEGQRNVRWPSSLALCHVVPDQGPTPHPHLDRADRTRPSRPRPGCGTPCSADTPPLPRRCCPPCSS
jgi:uncharacterized protein with HEPN domain